MTVILPPVPDCEILRQAALNSYNILNTLPEEDFDDITRLASAICNTPISLITLVDGDRQWFKSRIGLEGINETPRQYSFCAYAILQPQEMLIVPDSRKDVRFLNNPYVLGEPFVAFYAGVPLVSESGYTLGTLCVMDQQPRELTPDQTQALRALSNQVVKLLELRKSRCELETINKQLEQYNYVVAHDLKSPLNGIQALINLLLEDEQTTSNGTLKEYLLLLNEAGSYLSGMIGTLLEHAMQHQSAVYKEHVDVKQMVTEIIRLLFPPSHFQFIIQQELPVMLTNRFRLLQVFQNLLSNAIKYNDNPVPCIEVSGEDKGDFMLFAVKDNGQGIAEADHDRIFHLFTVTHNKSAADSSTGVGLGMLKQFVEEQGGRIYVSSQPGKGSTFFFEWYK